MQFFFSQQSATFLECMKYILTQKVLQLNYKVLEMHNFSVQSMQKWMLEIWLLETNLQDKCNLFTMVSKASGFYLCAMASPLVQVNLIARNSVIIVHNKRKGVACNCAL